MTLSLKDEILREQVIGRIERKFIDTVQGRLPEGSVPGRTITVPIINQVMGMAEHLQLPDRLIYKLAIVEYHKALSTVMTEKLHENLMETAVNNVINVIQGD